MRMSWVGRLSLLSCLGLLTFAAEAWGGPRLHIYGNWCGPGVGNRSTKKPIDAVDRACMLHDKCFLKKGAKGLGGRIQHCDCDRIIRGELKRAGRTKLSKKAKRKRKLMSLYFRLAKCWCRRVVCKKRPVCRRVRKCRKVLGKRRCVKVPKCRMVRRCKKRVVYGRGGRCK
ncbi:MAG: hypothetical protein EP343_20065 [Deltaproteobacteria bacterium]|nr:MAG: hypothetical protein EP343_20065 [Deltaproteobacteria bacterium]